MIIKCAKLAALGLAVSMTGCAESESQKSQDNLKPTGEWSAFQGGMAPTPQMGWSSWNAFKTKITEDKVIGSAQTIVDSGLADLGYKYINVDDGWWMNRRESDGRMQIRTQMFPSAATGGEEGTSFKPFVDKIHAMGLKTGIYTDIGYNSCAQSFGDHPGNPVGNRAQREVGLMGNMEKDIDLYFKTWGFDYLKADACGLSRYDTANDFVTEKDFRPHGPYIHLESIQQNDAAYAENVYGELSDTLRAANPDGDYVFSISSWGTANVQSWGKQHANSWRTSIDMLPLWTRMLHIVDSVSSRALYAGPGTWNDADMLFVGKREFDKNHLTEARSHFSLWAILNSPLIIGYDLRSAPESIMEIFGKEEIIALNQDAAGHQAVLAYNSDDLQIFVKTLSEPGEKAVAIFNRGQGDMKASLLAKHLKFKTDAPITATDLWSGKRYKPFKNKLSVNTKSRETIVLKVKGTTEIEGGLYLSEIPGRVNVAADGIVSRRHNPHVHQMVNRKYDEAVAMHARYEGWGGPQADVTPFGDRIILGGMYFPAGIGILANSRLEVRNDGEFDNFTARVGIDNSSQVRDRSVVFRVYGDGKLITELAAVTLEDGGVSISADIQGVDIIELVAQSDHDSPEDLIVAWADAQLK